MFYIKFHAQKLVRTLHECYTLFVVRTFGQYVITHSDDWREYSYRGKIYKIGLVRPLNQYELEDHSCSTPT